jgi:hypothetical protein
MAWWTGGQVTMLRERAAQRLSGRQIAWRINVAFGTFYSAAAVRRQAAVQGIALAGRSGPPRGNHNARSGSFVRARNGAGQFIPYAEAAD